MWKRSVHFSYERGIGIEGGGAKADFIEFRGVLLWKLEVFMVWFGLVWFRLKKPTKQSYSGFVKY